MITTGHLAKRFPLLKPHLNELFSLSYDPNTIDSERYARKARALAKACANAMSARETSTAATQVHTLFVGLHRRLDWSAPVAINAHLIANTLQAADILSEEG